MTARLAKELTYDAPLQTVHDMLLTAEFREQVIADQSVLRGRANVDGDVVTVDHVHSTHAMPSFVVKVIGREIEVVQVETWTSVRHADVEVMIPGKPGEIRGRIELLERDGQTIERVELSVTVRIPLVGAKVEAVIEDMLEKALEREQETGNRWLAG